MKKIILMLCCCFTLSYLFAQTPATDKLLPPPPSPVTFIPDEPPPPPIPPPPFKPGDPVFDPPVLANNLGYQVTIHEIEGKNVVIVKKKGIIKNIPLEKWDADPAYYEKKYGRFSKFGKFKSKAPATSTAH